MPFANPMTNNDLVRQAEPTSALSYVPHGSIDINGDDNFNDTATAEGWEGDGSPESPFLIQGYEIYNDETLIYITSTRYHFKILDCNLTYAWAAVQLWNVSNGVIENCLMDIPYFGVFMTNVTNIQVIGCEISVHPDFPESGVYMDSAIDCSVESCIIQGASGSEAGIYGGMCEGITLFNNTIFEFDNHGIFFGGTYDMDILNNTLYWNEGAGGGGPVCGILIVESLLANIEGNNITQNMDNGITISGVNNVTITENHIVENWIHGVLVEFSEYCVIQDNYIAGHGDGIIEGPACGVLTSFADYCQIIGNEFWWNALTSISLGYSNFGYIFGNYMNHSFDHGMWIYESHNATVEKNEVYNAYAIGSGPPACGILVEGSDDASLLRNTLGHNSENGITVISSSGGEVTGNTIFDSEYFGLFMGEASDWVITYNVIYDNGGPGIYLDVPTADNLLYYNDIVWSGEMLVVDEGFGNFWNSSGIGNWYSDYSGTGTYTIYGAPGEVDYYPSMSLYCGVTESSQYEAGTTGNTMTWNSSALNPGKYELLIDGVSQGYFEWDGEAIAADVDGLPVGVYNVTLIVYHVSGHFLANQSTLTVVDTTGPEWTITPVDQTLEYDEPLSYQVNATDPSGIASWAVNDTTNFAISGDGLITNATTLEPGVYYLEITVTDMYDNEVSVTIMITVNEPAPPYDPTMLMLAAGGIGAAVLLILVVYGYKRKGT
jgi:parallel beta-helix repeat protein